MEARHENIIYNNHMTLYLFAITFKTISRILVVIKSGQSIKINNSSNNQ